MLGMMGSGDEMRNEGGEGLKGESDDDMALSISGAYIRTFLTFLSIALRSGVKLYKGETLLELTERWRFIYKRLYDADEDRFDLSRIPDVHDNVRFDVLHNPHLGLTSTLERLYSLAKSMADSVVPQEYGTTLAEKRSVGIKICSPLLEKIRYDLFIARTDNKADMRYMINMDYTCYLTQIVIRLFEDTSLQMDNPRRFRVEILFSAGATATPLHMSESTRETDTSRLDTDRLYAIGRDGLTCKEVEEFFDSVISEGGGSDDVSLSTDAGAQSTKGESLKEAKGLDKVDAKKGTKDGEKSDENDGKQAAKVEDSIPTEITSEKRISDVEDKTVSAENKKSSTTEKSHGNPRSLASMGSEDTIRASNNKKESKKPRGFDLASLYKSDKPDDGKTDGSEPAKKNDEDDADDASKGMSHKTFYMTVALGTLLLGAGCLVMALSLTGGQKQRRRYTAR
ncbi:MAG: hypothetical protein SGARI_003824 [Bacillariaceae sp.]